MTPESREKKKDAPERRGRENFNQKTRHDSLRSSKPLSGNSTNTTKTSFVIGNTRSRRVELDSWKCRIRRRSSFSSATTPRSPKRYLNMWPVTFRRAETLVKANK